MTATTSAPPATAPEHPKRPRHVTALAVLVTLQGVMVGGIGALIIAAYDEPELEASLRAGSTTAMVTGIILAVVGAVQLILAFGLLRGSNGARSVIAAIATLETAASVYSLVALREAQLAGVWSLLLAVVVLWLLYGSERSQAFFDR